jgi:hypothetical protein
VAIRRFSTAEPGVKSNKFWDQDTAQGAMEIIATATGNGGSEVFSLTNIPQTYAHLKLVIHATSHILGSSFALDNFNATPTSNRSHTKLGVTAGGVVNGTQSNADSIAITASGGNVQTLYPITSVVYFLNYRSSAFKTLVWTTAMNTTSSGDVGMGVGTVKDTNPLTSFNLTTQVVGKYWNYGTTMTLYGIKGA